MGIIIEMTAQEINKEIQRQQEFLYQINIIPDMVVIDYSLRKLFEDFWWKEANDLKVMYHQEGESAGEVTYRSDFSVKQLYGLQVEFKSQVGIIGLMRGIPVQVIGK